MTLNRRTKYPWEDWTDGYVWTIVRGEDYQISTYNMQISLHGRARIQGLKVISRSFARHPDPLGDVEEGLVFRFHPVSDDAN